MNGKEWTSEEEQFLRDNYLEMTSRQIAKRLGRTHLSIHNKRFQMGLLKPSIIQQRPKSVIDEEIRLYNEGKSVVDIALTLHCSPDRLRQRLKSSGVYRPDHAQILGKRGEDMAEQYCIQNNLAYQRLSHNDRYDLIVNGIGVDVKYSSFYSIGIRFPPSTFERKDVGSEFWIIISNDFYKLRLIEKTK